MRERESDEKDKRSEMSEDEGDARSFLKGTVVAPFARALLGPGSSSTQILDA